MTPKTENKKMVNTASNEDLLFLAAIQDPEIREKVILILTSP